MRIIRGFPLVALLALAACETAGPTASTPEEPPVLLATTTGSVLVECPTDTELRTSETITGLGGTVTLGGHQVKIPAGALLEPTEITLVEPVSNYMKIHVLAGGSETFTFLEPVEITLSYERCTRSNIDKEPLEVWHVDEVTNELLENMGGVDDKDARAVTFTTDHLSGYAIAQ